MSEINQTIKKGYVEDYISGQQVQDTPEEIEAVQVFARQLVEDYGYSKDQIQTRPQWRVKSRPSDLKGYPVDIVVFKSEKKTEDNILIVVECKKLNRKDGRSQLENYLTFSKAYLGVWFNGEDRLFLRKIEKDGKVHFEEIVNIPRKEEDFESIGKFRRKDLTIPHNLKAVFKVIRNHLAGNAVGTTRDQTIAQELINLIFCKIYDEKFTKQDDLVRFRTGAVEKADDVQSRILELFSDVKKEYQDVLDFSDEITLDKNSIKFIVGELQNYCLIDSERDVIADAFEVFIGKALKGEHGQFFTPRNIVKLIVEFIDPDISNTIIDPACGSGGFLIEGLRYLWRKIDERGKEYGWSQLTIEKEKISVAENSMRGLEIDSFLAKVAKAYMAIIGDGKSGIFCEDSLEMPKNWKSKTRNKIGLEQFDVVFANPPFGKEIKVVGDEKLKQFDLAYKWKKTGSSFEITNKLNKEMSPQILFVERCLQLLKDGGKLGIILPETFFHAPKIRFVTDFIRKHNIIGLIDLPHNTFRPHNNAKCVVLILQKNKPQQKLIKMAVAEEMGHDHQGKIIHRWDYKQNKIDKDQVWDDLPLILSELKNPTKSKFTFDVTKEEIQENQVLVPRYYWQNKELEIQEIAESQNLELISIQDLIDKKIIKSFDGHGSPAAENKGMGEVPYIRVKDIVNWEVYKDPTSKIPEDVYLKMKGKKELQEKDILYVRRGSYRIGSVAMVSPNDKAVLLTREILVLRVANETNEYNLDAYYLLYLLSHRIISMQANNKILIETTLPNIADRWKELKLPINKDVEKRKQISSRINQAIDMKWSAIEEIEKLKAEFGELTT